MHVWKSVINFTTSCCSFSFFFAIQLYSHVQFCCSTKRYKVENFHLLKCVSLSLGSIGNATGNSVTFGFGEWKLIIIIIWMRIDANMRECWSSIRETNGNWQFWCLHRRVFEHAREKNLILCRLTVVIHLHRSTIDSMQHEVVSVRVYRYWAATVNVRGRLKHSHGKKITINYMSL